MNNCQSTVATSGLSTARFTVAPPTPAGALRTTVPTEEEPPGTVEGFSVRLLIPGGFTYSVADLLAEPSLAVMTAGTETVV